MFCTPGHVFSGTEGVGPRLLILRARTSFRRYGGRPVPFLCFALPDSFTALPRAYGPVFMICAHRHVFGGTDGFRSRFHCLLARTHFRRYRGRRVPLSCFALPDSFSAVPSASGPVFNFCAPELIFGSTEGVGSHINVLRFRTHFRRYRGRRVTFSCFACPESFSTVSRASGPVFMFCAPGLVFRGTERVWSRFHVLRARNLFRRYRGRRVRFSYFALPDSFSTVPGASGPVFRFCAPRLVFGGTECIGSHFRRYRGRRVPFSCFARSRGRWLPFSFFAPPSSFSAVPRASGPVFMFCTPELIFGLTARGCWLSF
jgi:hypothetical protein